MCHQNIFARDAEKNTSWTATAVSCRTLTSYSPSTKGKKMDAKCPKCGADEDHKCVFKCGSQILPKMPYESGTCRVNQVKNQLAALQVKYDRAVKLLLGIEWEGERELPLSCVRDGDNIPKATCPNCGCMKHDGHSVGCELAAILNESQPQSET